MAQEVFREDVEKVRGDIHQLCQLTVDMLQRTWDGFATHDAAFFQQAERLGQQIHQQEKTLTSFAAQQGSLQPGMRGVVQGLFLAAVHPERKRLDQKMQQQEETLTSFAAQQADMRGVVQGLWLVPVHLERIGDNIALIGRALTTMTREGVPFTERAVGEINTLFAKTLELLECVRDAISTQNRILIRHIQTEGQHYRAMINEYALSHQQRLIEGVCLPKASSVFVALLDYLKGIASHIGQIADKLSRESTS